MATARILPSSWTCHVSSSRRKPWITSRCSRWRIYARYALTTPRMYVLLIYHRTRKMLVVEDKIPGEDALANRGNFNIDEFIWPHGITPPLKHVRKRRFRKRVNRRVREHADDEGGDGILTMCIRIPE